MQGVWGSAEKKKAGPERQSEEDDEGDADTDRKESSDRGEKLKLHPELARFDWEYRQVLLCLDADRFKNKNVRQAEIRLAFLLHSAGAEVYQLSTWTLEEGKGVDDYLARRAGADLEKQREAFAELLRRARPFHATLTRHDIDLAKKELHRTQSDRAKFEQLASLIARPLETTKPGLGAFRGDPENETTGHDMGGAQPVDIPPTAPPWDEKVDAKEVLDLICAAISRFVWMKPPQCRAVALWIVLSYLHDVVDILPLLLITSPEEECGKTTLAELIYNLSNRPIAASNITSSRKSVRVPT